LSIAALGAAALFQAVLTRAAIGLFGHCQAQLIARVSARPGAISHFKDRVMTSTWLCFSPLGAPAMPRGPRLALALLLPLLAAVAGCSPAPTQKAATPATESKSSGAVVAKVNGVEVREGDLALAEDEIGQNMPPSSPETKREYLITYVTDMILIAQAAEAKKVDETDDFKRQLAYLRKKMLMESLMQAEAKAALSEAALHKVYDDATKQMGGEEEVRARHILVETEDEAKIIRAELEKGADFAELSKQKSKDTGAAAEGGDLGYFTKDQMVPEFADAAFKLDKGAISEPVKSPFGWHIIKVEDKRVKPVPEFDKVRSQLETYVMRKAQADYVAKLRADAKIEKMDTKPAAKPAEDSKAAPSAPPPPAEPEKK
jgi:peptidyl-prolyl cis-trans isomerase C